MKQYRTMTASLNSPHTSNPASELQIALQYEFIKVIFISGAGSIKP